MAVVAISDSILTDIADAIRSKNGQETLYKPSEMPDAIEAISGGGITPTGTKTITANGTGIDVAQYEKADVAVPNTYATGDEGKVVKNGALASQGSATYTSNNTYDTTEISSVTVNVSGGITPTGTKQISITQNGTTTEDVTNYANAEIVVNVSGGSAPSRLIDYKEIIFTTTATSANQLSVQLIPVEYYDIVVRIDTYPSAPDASEYIALEYCRTYYPAGSSSKGDILRPNGTIGSDNTMCSFNNTTGVLKLGGSYGHYMAGTKYHIYLFEIEVASV